MQTQHTNTMHRESLGSRGFVHLCLEFVLLGTLACALYVLTAVITALPNLCALPLALLALRHGGLSAIAASFLVIATHVTLRVLDVSTVALHTGDFLVPCLTALLCGYASDHWRTKLEGEEAKHRHQRQSMDELSLSHHLLHVSHARLEQRVVGGIDTLRESLQSLHRSLRDSSAKGEPLASRGPELLAQFDAFAWVQSASLHMVTPRQQVESLAVAEVGEPPMLDSTGALLQAAVKEGKTLAVTDVRAALNEKGPLVVTPIMNPQGNAIAVICVYKIPFLSFTQENLGLIAILSTHMGHLIDKSSVTVGASAQQDFTRTLDLAFQDSLKFDVISTVGQWTLDNTYAAQQAAAYIRDNVRGLDCPLLETVDHKLRLTLLCSMTNRADFDATIQRLEQRIEALGLGDFSEFSHSDKRLPIDGSLSKEELTAQLGLAHD